MSAHDHLPINLFRKVEHIGIAVQNLEEADQVYQKMLGVSSYKVEEVPSEGVRTAFYLVGDTKIELLEPTHAESPIARFLSKHGPGIHHIAFDVENIVESMQRLRQEGFRLTHEIPVLGADHKLVCFVHPYSTGGTLIELCQDIAEDSDMPSATAS